MAGKRTYTKREIADLYGVSIDTLRKWLRPMEEEIVDFKRRKVLTPKEVKQVFERLGSPFEQD